MATGLKWGRFLRNPSAKNPKLFMIPYDHFVHAHHDFHGSQYVGPRLTDNEADRILNAVCGEFEDCTCLSFTEATLQQLFEAAGFIAIERYGSATPGVEYLKIGKVVKDLPISLQAILPTITPLPEYPFEITDFDGNRRSTFAMIASRLLGPVLRRKIMLSVPHKRYREYSPRGAFQINIWSTSDQSLERMRNTPMRIWNIPVACTDGSFRPEASHREGSVFIQDGDYVVAELLQNALYIHHDICHAGHMSEFELFAKILEKAAEHLGKEDWELRRQHAQVAFARQQKAIFSDFVQKGIPHRAKRHKDKIEATEREVEAARLVYTQAERDLCNLRLATIDPERVAENFQKEFERIASGNIADVLSVTIHQIDDGYQIRVQTKELIAYDRSTGKNHLLGYFEIVLYLDNGSVRFINLDRRVNGFKDGQHAPHVYSDGRACLGNIEMELSAYIAHYEIDAAIALAMAFLQNGADPDDPMGAAIRLFPVVETADARGVAA